MTTITLDELNRCDRERFVGVLGGVFEHSPWVAERVFGQRPFESVDALHAAMSAAVDAATDDARLALVRAHPELAGRAAIAGELTAESKQEQRGAGLDRCTPEEFARLHALNSAYRERFGFPFIIAVRGHDRHSIIAVLAKRLGNAPADEQHEALRQIARIAGFRLHDIIQP